MEPETVTNDTTHPLADDLLRGADEIAEFIFGERGSRRKVYYLAECTRLPVFRLTGEEIGLMNPIFLAANRLEPLCAERH